MFFICSYLFKIMAAEPEELLLFYFGGELKITITCAQCNTNYYNLDKFQDAQLCFSEGIKEDEHVPAENLINYHLQSESSRADNKYHGEKCKELCDAEKNTEILRPSSYSILTLKHVRYDRKQHQLRKLKHNVMYNKDLPRWFPGVVLTS